MYSNEQVLATLRTAAESEGLLGQSLYIEKGDAKALPFADRLVDLIVVSDMADGDLTPELKKEWSRALGPKRGAALVGRAKAAGKGLSSRALSAWVKDLPLARTISDPSGLWSLLRTEFPKGTDSWTHRWHGPENTQVSSDTTFKAPFMTQWWGMPRQEGFWGTTVVTCNGRLFAVRGSRHSGGKVSLTARCLNNGIVLWQKNLRQAVSNNVPHGGYIPGRSCAAATDDSLFLVSSSVVVRLAAETGEELGRIPGPKPGGQVKWIACSGDYLAMMGGETDAVTAIAYQTVANNPYGRELAVYDTRKNKVLWRDTATGDIDERYIVIRDDMLYSLGQGEGLVCRSLKNGKRKWANTSSNLQAEFKTPNMHAIGQLLVSLPVLSAYDQVLLLRAKWVKGTWALSRKDGSILWTNVTAGGSYRGLTACAVGNTWVGSGASIDMLTGKTNKGPQFIMSGCGPTTYAPGYLITCFGKISDVSNNTIIRSEDIKSPCDVGTIVSEGMMVTVPSECACYYKTKGYRALAAAGAIKPSTAPDWKSRLTVLDTSAPKALEVAATDWPTYRHDPARSAASPVTVGAASNVLWRWMPPGAEPFTNKYMFATGQYLKPAYLATAPVAVAGRVWFVSPDGIVRCLDAATGREQWNFAMGCMAFAPPTVAEGRLFVGGGDGRLYCLDATTGKCLWNFMAAPIDRRLFWFGHLVSTWPLLTGVVVKDGIAYTVAGYQNDNGIHAYAIDSKSGQVLWENDTASIPAKGLQEGFESLGDMAVGNGKMWICSRPAGYFDLTNGVVKATGVGHYGCEIGLLGGKWVVQGGRRLSETQDTLSAPLSGAGFSATSDEVPPQAAPLIDIGTSLPAWDDELVVMPPRHYIGKMSALSAGKFLEWLDGRKTAQDAYNKAPKEAKPKLVEWQDLKTWETTNMVPASFVLAGDQAVVAGLEAKTNSISGFNRIDGAKVWTAVLPEQPAMNRMALDREGRLLVALCDGSVICLGR